MLLAVLAGCSSSFGSPPEPSEPSVAPPNPTLGVAPGIVTVVPPDPVGVPFEVPDRATLPLASYRVGDCAAMWPQPSSSASPIVTSQGVFLETTEGVERFDGSAWHLDAILDDDGTAPTEHALRLGPDGHPLLEAEFGGPADRRIYLFDGDAWNELWLDGGFPWWVFAVGDTVFMERYVGLFRRDVDDEGADTWTQVADWPWPRGAREWSPSDDEHFLWDYDVHMNVVFLRWTPDAGFVQLPTVSRDRVPLRYDASGQANLRIQDGEIWRFGGAGAAPEPLPGGVDPTTCRRRFRAPSVFELDCDGQVVRLDAERERLVLDERPRPPGAGATTYGFAEDGSLAASVTRDGARKVMVYRDEVWDAFPSQTTPSLTTRVVGVDLDQVFVGATTGVYRVFEDGLASIPATSGWRVVDLAVSGSGTLAIVVGVDPDPSVPGRPWSECLELTSDEASTARDCPRLEVWRGRPGVGLWRELSAIDLPCEARDGCLATRDGDDLALVTKRSVYFGVRGRWRRLNAQAFGIELGFVDGVAWPQRPSDLVITSRPCPRCGSAPFAGTVEDDGPEASDVSYARWFGFAGAEVSVVAQGAGPASVQRPMEAATSLPEGLLGRVVGAHEDGRLLLRVRHDVFLEAAREPRELADLVAGAAATWSSGALIDTPALTDGRTLITAAPRGIVRCVTPDG